MKKRPPLGNIHNEATPKTEEYDYIDPGDDLTVCGTCGLTIFSHTDEMWSECRRKYKLRHRIVDVILLFFLIVYTQVAWLGIINIVLMNIQSSKPDILCYSDSECAVSEDHDDLVLWSETCIIGEYRGKDNLCHVVE